MYVLAKKFGNDKISRKDGFSEVPQQNLRKAMAKKLEIKELTTLDEMMSAHPLVSQMYKEMDLKTYRKNIEEMMKRNDFKMVAAFLNEKIVGVSGYWISLMLYCGRYLQASNLVVDSESRGLGIGGEILNYLERKAKKSHCQKIVLDSYTENKKSHSLYYRNGFYVRGFHFMKNIQEKN